MKKERRKNHSILKINIKPIKNQYILDASYYIHYLLITILIKNKYDPDVDYVACRIYTNCIL